MSYDEDTSTGREFFTVLLLILFGMLSVLAVIMFLRSASVQVASFGNLHSHFVPDRTVLK